MKKILSILTLSSLVIVNNVVTADSDPAIIGPGGTQQAQIIIGPGGTQRIIGPGGTRQEQGCGKMGAHWCPAQNKCVATQFFSVDSCFPTGLNPRPQIGPDGIRRCLMGQLYCPADGTCRRFGNPTAAASASIINQCQIQPMPVTPVDNGSTGYTVATDGSLIPISNSTTGYTYTVTSR